MTTALDHIRDEVRDLVRRRGLDPVSDPHTTRHLIDEVTDSYDERAGRTGLPLLHDRDHVRRSVFDDLAGFGPLQRFFDDPTVEEIWINQPGTVFVARHGRSELTTTVLTADEV